MSTETRYIPTDPAAGRWWPLRRLALALALLAPGGCDEFAPPYTRKPIAVNELPETVHGAAKKAVRGVAFEEAWKNLDRDGNLQSYEVRGKTSKGKTREVRVSPTGDILEME